MNKILSATIIAATLWASPAYARETRYAVATPNLTFEVNPDGSRAAFVITGDEQGASRESDFWRLILDDGERTEIPVLSSMQHGKVEEHDGNLTIKYDRLVSEYGDTYPVAFTLKVDREGTDLIKFTPIIDNKDKHVRVNECFCPLADFTRLCGEKRDDKMFLPHGLGRRIVNPWKALEDMTPTYYKHDENETYLHMHYPRASMGWFGVQSGDKFLYVSRPDDKFRHCFMTVRHRIHGDNLMFGVDHFPMARPGEKLTEPSTVIGLLDGDWRSGADIYRAWADANFFKVQPKADWVKDMTGWQRIIMRSQYGEDYYKPEDLPQVWLNGAKCGLNTLFLFAWWKEGMDRGYPEYTEPYPGAFKVLSESIKKIQDMGGHVVLECNCHFLDPHGEFYRKHGDLVKIIDINGNEVRPAFVYHGKGELRGTYGAVQFPLVCAGTQMWRDQVVKQLKMMGDLGADCVFADCYGGCPYQPCFNTRHEHGNRIDEEWIAHRKFFDQALDYCNSAGKVLSAEVVTDIAAAYTQMIHGLVNVDFKLRGDAYPAMFRYTFPEVITTCRNILSSDGEFDKQLKYALVNGVRLDAQLWVCRADMSRDQKYASMARFYTDKLKEHGRFFLDGKFTVIDNSELPVLVKRGEYLSADGKEVMRVLYNASAKSIDACGTTLAPDEMKFEVFDADTYRRSI